MHKKDVHNNAGTGSEPMSMTVTPFTAVSMRAAVTKAVMVSAGHTKDVVDLSACPGKPRLLVSLSKDGNVRVWDTAQELCTTSYSTDASCVVSMCMGMLQPFLDALPFWYLWASAKSESVKGVCQHPAIALHASVQNTPL